MVDLSNGTYWKPVDSSNNAASPNGWTPGVMTPSEVEPTAQAMMGGMRRWWERQNATVTTTGSAGAYVYTPVSTLYPVALVDGEVYRLHTHQASAGNDTLNANSLGAKKVYKFTSSGAAQIAANDWLTGQDVSVAYDSSLDSAAGGWQWLEGGVTTNSALSGALSVAFTNVDVTLSANQQLNVAYVCTGILSGAVNLIFRTSGTGPYIVFNNTTGNFTLSAKVSGGTAIAIRRGSVALFYSNGTDLTQEKNINFDGDTSATAAAIVNQVILKGGTAASGGAVVYAGGPSSGANANLSILSAGTTSTIGLGTVGLGNQLVIDNTNAWIALLTGGAAGSGLATQFAISAQSTGANAAACVMSIPKDTGTNRSINAAGTLNASGADYAEYEHKSPACPTINAGDLCGFDKNGLLTMSFSAVVSRFAIKSTNPNLVGGDSWANHLGERPAIPHHENATPEEIEAAEALIAEFNAQLEDMRKKFDRIAYCGKTPANIPAMSADVGKFVVPVAGPGDTISAKLIDKTSLGLAQLIDSIGIVHAIGDDGRPVIAVGIR